MVFWLFMSGDMIAALLISGLVTTLVPGLPGLLIGLTVSVVPQTAAWMFYLVFSREPNVRDLMLVPDLLAMYGVPPLAPLLVLAALAVLLIARWRPRRPERGAWPLLAVWAGVGGVLFGQAFFESPLQIRHVYAAGFAPFQMVGQWPAFVMEIGEYLIQRRLLADIRDRPARSFLDVGLPPLSARSIHVIVMESFWRADRLSFAMTGEPVFSPPVRALFDQQGGTALSPVFGNHSGNAEFEILCGLPAIGQEGEIPFKQIRRPLDCLPRKLADAGWVTVGMVDNDPGVYSVGTAYKLLGFQQTRFAADFRHDRNFAAAAQFRQNLEVIAPLLAAGRKVLNYQFVNSGHYPFLLNDDQPRVVSIASPDDDALVRHLNLEHYNGAALLAYIQDIRRLDPEAVIVMTGDHLPLLGTDFATYRLGGIIAADGLAPADRKALQTTPLLVFRGDRPLILTAVPDYLIPEAILEAASDGEFCRNQACGLLQSTYYRSLGLDVLRVDSADGSAGFCAAGDATPDCVEPARWLRQHYGLLLSLYDD